MRKADMRIAIVSFTRQGDKLNIELKRRFLEDDILRQRATGGLQGIKDVDSYRSGRKREDIGDDSPVSIETGLLDWVGEAFTSYDAMIFVGAAGIAVRSIAPHVRDKFSDPAVIVVDEKGSFVVPILSGHVGGANALAREIAGITGGVSVITTATDIQARFAVDVFAADNRLIICDREAAKLISADILEGKDIGLYIDKGIELDKACLPDGLYVTDDASMCRINIGYFGRRKKDESSAKAVDLHLKSEKEILNLVPQGSIWIGIGCKRGTKSSAIREAIKEFMDEHAIRKESIIGLASIDIKSDEAGIVEFASDEGIDFVTFSAEKLQSCQGSFSASTFVKEHTGVDNVCERAAMCAAGDGAVLLIKKSLYPGITLAAAGVRRILRFRDSK